MTVLSICHQGLWPGPSGKVLIINIFFVHGDICGRATGQDEVEREVRRNHTMMSSPMLHNGLFQKQGGPLRKVVWIWIRDGVMAGGSDIQCRDGRMWPSASQWTRLADYFSQ